MKVDNVSDNVQYWPKYNNELVLITIQNQYSQNLLNNVEIPM